MRKIRDLIIVSIIFLFTVTANANELTGLSLSPGKSKTHISLTFQSPTAIHFFTLSNPSRLVIDMTQTKTTLPLNKIYLKNTPVKAIRSSISHGQMRLIFDLRQKPKSLSKHNFSNKKFTFDLTFNHTQLQQISPSKPKKIKPKKNPFVPIKTHVTTKPLRDAIIVIDAGHGGKDPGAIGPHGTCEKDVVLIVAKDLYTLLRKQKGIHPILTRNKDYFVPLRRRLNLARQKNTADLFISIHADAYRNILSRGASVFALSQHGATSEAARWLAQKENYSELGSIDLAGKSHSLRSVLIDLSQTATIEESLILGNAILSSVRRIARLHVGEVEQAPFVVLKAPDIPSVLVELGFISNRQEERQLRSDVYQQRMAHAIKNGIIHYLHQSPPQGTIWEKPQSTRHKVKRGEYLSGIAKQYGISTKKLKQFNHLKSETIRLGQVLKIPTKNQS